MTLNLTHTTDIVRRREHQELSGNGDFKCEETPLPAVETPQHFEFRTSVLSWRIDTGLPGWHFVCRPADGRAAERDASILSVKHLELHSPLVQLDWWQYAVVRHEMEIGRETETNATIDKSIVCAAFLGGAMLCR